MSDKSALFEIEGLKGKQLDPVLVESFMRAYEDKLIVSQNILSAEDPLSHLREL